MSESKRRGLIGAEAGDEIDAGNLLVAARPRAAGETVVMHSDVATAADGARLAGGGGSDPGRGGG